VASRFNCFAACFASSPHSQPRGQTRKGSNLRHRSGGVGFGPDSCPLWVKSRHMRCNRACPLYPNSDGKSRHAQTVMSALPPKADMCSAVADVRYGPIADSCTATKPPRFSGESGLDHSPMVLGDVRRLIKLTPERHR